MKKLVIFFVTIAMVLGMSQCKKRIETITPTPTPNSGNMVYISLKVGGDSKYDVYTNTGAVVYTKGDKIYVGNHGKYIGYLEYEDGTFSGKICDPVTTDYLHFYFLGGLEPSRANSLSSLTDAQPQSTPTKPQLTHVCLGTSAAW